MTPGETPSPHDPSLAGTRTTLAWRRSILLVAATGGLLAKAAISEGQEVLGVVAGSGLLLVAVALYLLRGRQTATPSAGADQETARRRALQALCGVAVLAAAVSLAIVLTIS